MKLREQIATAAPELLKALECVRMHKCMFDCDADFLEACAKVDDAIAKAKGDI